MSHYSDETVEFANSTNSSNEIAYAILSLADGNGESAMRIWADPTSAEDAEVLRIAWGLADEDDTELYWGEETIKRVTNA